MNVVTAIGLIGDALLFGHVLHALTDQSFSLRVQCQFDTQSARCALPRVVIRCSTDATAGKHHIAAGKGPLQGGCDPIRRITDVIGVSQLQTARLEQLYDFGQVLVGPLARENFIANDDQAERRRGADWNFRC